LLGYKLKPTGPSGILYKGDDVGIETD